MTFEQDFLEKFPSLKGKVFGCLEDIGQDDGTEEERALAFGNSPSVSVEDVDAVCLDKSKVKQAIQSIWDKTETMATTHHPVDVHIAKRELLSEVLKELGLRE